MKRLLQSLSILLCMAALGSCKIDNQYDLSKLDTSVTVLKGATFGFGSLSPISLKDMFGFQENEFLVTDDAGDYRIRFRPDPLYFTATVPASGSLEITDGSDILQFEVDTDALPEFLRGDSEIVAELPDIQVGVKVDNGFPVGFETSAVVEASLNGQVTRRYPIDDLYIGPGVSEFMLNETGSGIDNELIYKKIEDLGKLLSPIPDLLKVSEFSFSADDESSLTPGTTYGVTFSFDVDAPLAFSAQSKVRMVIPVDASLDLEYVGLKKAELRMNVTNTVPLDFSVAVYALDGQGDRKENVSAKTDVPVAAGTQVSPAVTPVTVSLTTDGDLRFQGLEIELSASSNDRVAGTHFNQGQALAFRDLVLYLPDGIQVDLTVE